MDASVSPKADPKNTFAADVREIVTEKYVQTAQPSDNVLGVQPTLVLQPANEQEIAKVLKLANAAGLAVIPRGGGTKLGWSDLPTRADLILSTARMNRVLEHPWADLTVSVEAVCTIAKLQETVAKHGQRLALDPLWPERATVGGVLSTNDSGAVRLRFGSLRDLVIGVTVALADGTLASSGGKVVKNVAGYDLPKLLTGAFGTLGVITRAIFRLHPAPKATRTISCVMADAAEAQRLVLAIQNSNLAHSALQVCCGAEMRPRVDVLLEGIEAGVSAQSVQLKMLANEATQSSGMNDVWNSRQELFSAIAAGDTFAVAKFVTLPADIGETVEMVARFAGPALRWSLVVQATGIGWLRMSGLPAELATAVRGMREQLEGKGGSLVLARRPAEMLPAGAWGTPGDAIGLMKAVKHQFDPQNILNPGCFVGGI